MNTFLARATFFAGLLLVCSGVASAQQTLTLSGAPCVTPPPMKCPDADCSGDRIANQGSVVEMKTRRTYFLDYPCDLKQGEKVTFILSLKLMVSARGGKLQRVQ